MLLLVSWVQCHGTILAFWVFRVSIISSRGYFVDRNIFLEGVSQIQNFFWYVFGGSKMFSRRCFMGPIFFVVANFVIQRVSIVGCIIKSDRNCVFYSRSISTIASSVYIWKELHLLNQPYYYAAFICTNCIFSHLFSSVIGSLHS